MASHLFCNNAKVSGRGAEKDNGAFGYGVSAKSQSCLESCSEGGQGSAEEGSGGEKGCGGYEALKDDVS